MSYNALTIVSPAVLEVKEYSLKKAIISPAEILVSVKAVALNPTDWKHRDFVSPVGSFLGCDFAGVVSHVGEAVTNVKVGDRVAGFVHGGRGEGVGSFAETVKTEGSLVWKVPDNTDFEEAAALGGIGPHTAVQALYMRHHLPLPSSPITTATPFLVWGGATSVGLYAIQLLKLSGYTVIATCSPKNYDLVKSYGATSVYSYADPSTPSVIKEAYPALALGLDTISEKGTTPQLASCFPKGGKIVTLLPVTDELPEGVTAEMTLVYTVIGKPFNMMGHDFAASASDKKTIEEWLVYVPSLIAAGKFKSNPLWRQKGGLAGVDAGLNLLKEGKNSGQKVTFAI